MKTEFDYKKLQDELHAIEEQTGMYLADSNVDFENVVVDRDHLEFWDQAYFAACNAAGFRAEENGQNINALLGRQVY